MLPVDLASLISRPQASRAEADPRVALASAAADMPADFASVLGSAAADDGKAATAPVAELATTGVPEEDHGEKEAAPGVPTEDEPAAAALVAEPAGSEVPADAGRSIGPLSTGAWSSRAPEGTPGSDAMPSKAAASGPGQDLPARPNVRPGRSAVAEAPPADAAEDVADPAAGDDAVALQPAKPAPDAGRVGEHVMAASAPQVPRHQGGQPTDAAPVRSAPPMPGSRAVALAAEPVAAFGPEAAEVSPPQDAASRRDAPAAPEARTAPASQATAPGGIAPTDEVAAAGLDDSGPPQGGREPPASAPADPRGAAVRAMPAQVTPQAVAGQVAVAVGRAEGERIDIRLDPPELGRVEIRLSQDQGGVHASVIAERAEVHDLLRRHAQLLLAELDAAGFARVTLEFSTAPERDAWQDRPEAPSFMLDAEPKPAPTAPTAAIAPGARPAGGLDIRL
jgi:flagellar hook-length control protein FliK